jgi:hypothetical protein
MDFLVCVENAVEAALEASLCSRRGGVFRKKSSQAAGNVRAGKQAIYLGYGKSIPGPTRFSVTSHGRTIPASCYYKGASCVLQAAKSATPPSFLSKRPAAKVTMHRAGF